MSDPIVAIRWKVGKLWPDVTDPTVAFVMVMCAIWASFVLGFLCAEATR